MRFDVSSTALLSRLQSISKVIASKNSLPILDSFLFNLEGNTLTVTASDAETRLVTSVDVMNAQGAGLLRAIYRAVFRRRRNVLRAASGKRNHRFPNNRLLLISMMRIWRFSFISRMVSIILSVRKGTHIRSRSR